MKPPPRTLGADARAALAGDDEADRARVRALERRLRGELATDTAIAALLTQIGRRLGVSPLELQRAIAAHVAPLRHREERIRAELAERGGRRVEVDDDHDDDDVRDGAVDPYAGRIDPYEHRDRRGRG